MTEIKSAETPVDNFAGQPAADAAQPGALNVDMRTEGVDARQKAKPRGRKDKDRDDGEAIKLEPLKKSLRELGTLAEKANEANAKVKAAVKAVAEKSGLLSSVVRRLVKAHSGDSDHFADEKRKVEQLGIVFDEIAYEGEITKAAAEPKA